MSAIDLNDAEPQREGGLIPEGTISLAVMTLRSGGFGDDGFLAKSKSSGGDMLDAEFTLVGGKYERRKVWKYLSLHGDAGPVTRSQLRAALESAHGVFPEDASPAAQEKRRAATYGVFNGLCVCVKIGIEKGKDSFPDKNVIRAFVTPDRPEYIAPGPQVGGLQTAGSASAGAVRQVAAKVAAGAGKPSWAS